MGAILTVAGHTFREGIRRRIFWVPCLLCFALIAAAAVLPCAGGRADRLRLMLDVSLRGIGFFGLLTGMLISCTWLPAEIRARRLYTVLTKPVSRAAFMLGRALGSGGLAASLVLATGAGAVLAVRAAQTWVWRAGGEGDPLAPQRRVLPVAVFFEGAAAMVDDEIVLTIDRAQPGGKWFFEGIDEPRVRQGVRVRLEYRLAPDVARSSAPVVEVAFVNPASLRQYAAYPVVGKREGSTYSAPLRLDASAVAGDMVCLAVLSVDGRPGVWQSEWRHGPQRDDLLWLFDVRGLRDIFRDVSLETQLADAPESAWHARFVRPGPKAKGPVVRLAKGHAVRVGLDPALPSTLGFLGVRMGRDGPEGKGVAAGRVRVGKESLILLRRPGSLELNVAKCLAGVVCKVLLMVAVGTMGSAVLSGGGAILLSAGVYASGSSLAFLRGIAESITVGGGEAGGEATRLGPGPVFTAAVRLFCRVVPDMTVFDMSSQVVGGLDIPSARLLHAAGCLALYAVPCLLAGALLFHRRELP